MVVVLGNLLQVSLPEQGSGTRGSPETPPILKYFAIPRGPDLQSTPLLSGGCHAAGERGLIALIAGALAGALGSLCVALASAVLTLGWP